jgi:hypothetical protein
MAITNILDQRKRHYRFRKINAIVEAAWHDNSCPDADQVGDIRGPDYQEREHISLQEAVRWANEWDAPVTLYLYDEDGGIYIGQ